MTVFDSKIKMWRVGRLNGDTIVLKPTVYFSKEEALTADTLVGAETDRLIEMVEKGELN